jgi:AAA ATPase domain
MAGSRLPVGTLGEVLASRRRRCFVGRDGELELARAALAGTEPPFSVMWLTGPGGIGKTSLLKAIAEEAEAAGGWRVVRLDGRELPSSPRVALDVVREALGAPHGDEAVAVPEGRLVLLFDAYERLGALDDWVRTWLLPRLPAAALTVVAGRELPGPAWRADPAWRELLRVVALRNLGPEESRGYLRACGVDEAVHDRLIQVSHGHPLGLSLLADVVARGGEATLDPLAPDLVGTLVRRFVDVVPEELRRSALEVCALARVTTEGLLRDTVAVEDAHELFAWLRELSFVESGPDGLLPHDLARDVLDADLRWRDPEGYKDRFRRVRGHIYAALKSSRGREQQRSIFDLKFLFRNLPGVLSPVDWDVWGLHYPEPAGPGDGASILELVAASEGQASAAIAERWLDLQLEGFVVVRGEDDEVRGFVALLDLTAVSAQDRRGDPGAEAAWEYAHGCAPPRPGEVITHTRFVVDGEAYQGPSPTLNAVPIVTLQRYLRKPPLAWDFLALHEPEPWDEFFALADLPRATGADFVVGGRRYGLYGHDFRRVPVDALMELWTERALAQDVTLRPAAPDDVLVLSQAGFTDAVRQALRDLHRPELLARNPLVRTRLARDYARSDEPDADALARLLRAAVEGLRHDPRDDKLQRAVERTYLQAAPTQEAAADVLGLPFSTYRRHLSEGVRRIVAWLWDHEVYGTAPEQR